MLGNCDHKLLQMPRREGQLQRWVGGCSITCKHHVLLPQQLAQRIPYLHASWGSAQGGGNTGAVEVMEHIYAYIS